MIKIYLNGEHYSTLNQMPSTIPGVKLSNLQSATKEQLLKHGITTEEYTPPEPTPEELAKACEAAIQDMLDAKANELEYESIHTANGWVGELPECDILKAWGGECWIKSKAIRDAIMAGERTMPESVEAFMAEIPTYDEYMGGL
jgi:hypothetical protein